ncbi:ribose transport system substrate-binding protein [Paenibacillus endophyticus]|uniref:Ribose transport system substrate-binding protein n=1 Tax=Paenibacillus endophyticus TaxID=1294268 RepID=A0A7W5G8A9_9BACL|nr:substrate-binding domain-containing protein [Paenibacillus endophyticus]MBB3150431.1 ribose transport system substrate-binding protein [Paenibacillus endophyticus]
MPSRFNDRLVILRFTIVIMGIGLLLHATGCMNVNDSDAPPVRSEAAIPNDANAPAFTFGIIYPISHPFYETVTERAEQAAAEAGGRLIVKAPDEASLEQQIRLLENMIRLKVDGIALSPINSQALAPYIDLAIESGIPVVCFESDAPSSRRLTYIGGDNAHAGAQMAQSLEGLLRESGMVLVESGLSTMSSHKQRLDGFLGYIRDNTDIQVVELKSHEGSDAHALAELEQMINNHPHFDAFVALDFISGSSSILAWKAMGLNRYALTFGMTPSIEEAIRNGQITLAVTQNEAVWGTQIVSTLLQAMQGEPVPDTFSTGESIIDLRKLSL